MYYTCEIHLSGAVVAEKVVNTRVKRACYLRQQSSIGKRVARLPFADSLSADVDDLRAALV